MSATFGKDDWGVILGGSSGFGLATAHKLAAQGMSLCVVHRDRRGAMKRIEPEFEKLRGHGVQVCTFNTDALSPEKRGEVLDALREAMGEGGRVRMLLHSIAVGNLKLLAPEAERRGPSPAEKLASALGVETEKVVETVDRLFGEGEDALAELATPPEFFPRTLDAEDFARTIHSMGTSLVDWVQDLHARGLFAADARVFGLTSEGNEVAWKGYAAVSAAKVAMEAACRSIAAEFGPHGVRCNVLQPGVTDTPALQAIPGSDRLKAHSRLRNPMGRLTTPRDVAGVVYLLCLPEAAWINGTTLRVDGGERISGSTV
ncbi:MAG: SDR family oxidoreductase [Myxococcota bacterium]|nr:SDR family oxidoreductase [Myxococcota bacterium]